MTKAQKPPRSSLVHLDSNDSLSALVHKNPLVAHTEFPISRNKDGNPPPLEIALSHDASRMAVFPSIDLDRSEFPSETFRLFEYRQDFTPALRDEKELASIDGLLRPSKELLRVKHPLNRFSGYGRFHTERRAMLGHERVFSNKRLVSLYLRIHTCRLRCERFHCFVNL